MFALTFIKLTRLQLSIIILACLGLLALFSLNLILFLQTKVFKNAIHNIYMKNLTLQAPN